MYLENSLNISSLNFDQLDSLYQRKENLLNWNLVFTLPSWLRTWWDCFHAESELFIRSIERNGILTGIAPLQIQGKTASIIGNVDVCDYQDFIIVPGQEQVFFRAMLDDLRQKGLTDLHLETIRPDSTIVEYLMPLADECHFRVDYQPSDVSSILNLPSDWNEYLARLDGKQRHEIRRKMRNLNNLGENHYHCTVQPSETAAAIDTFLRLFPESRGDKAIFMTDQMQIYFKKLTSALSEYGVVRFGTLEFEKKAVAMVMYFDYNEGMYLYNSAYDPAFRELSVGIISKAACIQDSIQKGKSVFDFLKGPEVYKSYLGGATLQLYSCHIYLK
jgi:CelD/BcsL family acetyltransferase involved in cellulose biosynthesis